MPETGEEDPIYISYYVTRAQLEEVFWDVHSWSAGSGRTFLPPEVCTSSSLFSTSVEVILRLKGGTWWAVQSGHYALTEKSGKVSQEERRD